MTRVILSGCGGRMGTVLTELIEKMSDMRVVAGIDIVSVERPYPVFASLESCTEQADVMIDFSSSKSLHAYLPVAVSRNLPIVVATTGLARSELAMLGEASASIPVFRS